MVKVALVVVCSKCGRGILGASRAASVDRQPTWWLVDDNGKPLEGPMCNGLLVSVERNAQVQKVWADPIVPASEMEVLDAEG